MKEQEIQIAKNLQEVQDRLGLEFIAKPKPKEKPHYKISREDYIKRLIGARDIWMQEAEKLNMRAIEINKNLLQIRRMMEEEIEARQFGLGVTYMYDPNKEMIYTILDEPKQMGFIKDEGKKGDIHQKQGKGI